MSWQRLPRTSADQTRIFLQLFLSSWLQKLSGAKMKMFYWHKNLTHTGLIRMAHFPVISCCLQLSWERWPWTSPQLQIWDPGHFAGCRGAGSGIQGTLQDVETVLAADLDPGHFAGCRGSSDCSIPQITGLHCVLSVKSCWVNPQFRSPRSTSHCPRPLLAAAQSYNPQSLGMLITSYGPVCPGSLSHESNIYIIKCGY